jgi:hypothetical protein
MSMSAFAAGLLVFGLVGFSGDAPQGPPKPDAKDITPETRVDPDPKGDEREPLGRLMIGLRLHGPRFLMRGDGTKESPFVMDLPLGDLLKVRIIYPCVHPSPLSQGALF